MLRHHCFQSQRDPFWFSSVWCLYFDFLALHLTHHSDPFWFSAVWFLYFDFLALHLTHQSEHNRGTSQFVQEFYFHTSLSSIFQWFSPTVRKIWYVMTGFSRRKEMNNSVPKLENSNCYRFLLIHIIIFFLSLDSHSSKNFRFTNIFPRP